MAVPPAASISATTASAASLWPVPSRLAPRSLTTTLAPRRASSSAYARPRPPPAPVTMATRPSKLIVICANPPTGRSWDQPVRGSGRGREALAFDAFILAPSGRGKRSLAVPGATHAALVQLDAMVGD